jgi:hypothetical protein
MLINADQLTSLEDFVNERLHYNRSSNHIAAHEIVIQKLCDLFNIAAIRSDKVKTQAIAKEVIGESISYCQRVIAEGEGIIGHGHRLEFVCAPAFDMATIIGERNKAIELAELSKHGEVKKMFQQTICFYADFYRALYLNKHDDVLTAINNLNLVSRSKYGSLQAEYNLAPKLIAEVFGGIVQKKPDNIKAAIKSILKWHLQSAKKTYINIKTGLPVPSMLISRPIIAAIILAKNNGMKIDIAHELVPSWLLDI